MPLVRVSIIPLALLTSLFGGCTEMPFLATADLSIQADEEVATDLQYPLLLTMGFSPDAIGDRILGAVGELTPEPWLICEAPENEWAIQTQLHQQLAAGKCDDIDPHVVVRAHFMETMTDCQPGSDAIFENGTSYSVDPDNGVEIARAVAPVFAQLDGCGTYEDTVTLTLQGMD
jgi:hypothetical protein